MIAHSSSNSHSFLKILMASRFIERVEWCLHLHFHHHPIENSSKITWISDGLTSCGLLAERRVTNFHIHLGLEHWWIVAIWKWKLRVGHCSMSLYEHGHLVRIQHQHLQGTPKSTRSPCSKINTCNIHPRSLADWIEFTNSHPKPPNYKGSEHTGAQTHPIHADDHNLECRLQVGSFENRRSRRQLI
jgi:hypothetical protein